MFKYFIFFLILIFTSSKSFSQIKNFDYLDTLQLKRIILEDTYAANIIMSNNLLKHDGCKVSLNDSVKIIYLDSFKLQFQTIYKISVKFNHIRILWDKGSIFTYCLIIDQGAIFKIEGFVNNDILGYAKYFKDDSHLSSIEFYYKAFKNLSIYRDKNYKRIVRRMYKKRSFDASELSYSNMLSLAKSTYSIVTPYQVFLRYWYWF